ncbi:anti-sigma-I factor RsgI2-like isoform X1 [Dicentrarchus labrax]|uniref:anti-sigma-I factor RsgI2-like isoform X1 n=1 Tax=Dicentrarchus labrax TaxID=13489 RepID=UPI0021F54322|nr:anti-sigma-I factor RsgI2-like isoform X1 [Dicentrarchus labrax]
MKQLYVLMVMAVMSALVNSGAATTTRKPWTTSGSDGQNLNGKMFTLSRDGGGIYFYPPGYSPWFITTPYPTRRYTTRGYFTTTTPKPTTTTPRPTTTTPKPTTTTYKRTTTTPKPTTTTPKPTTTTPKPTTTTYPPWTTAPSTRGVSVCLRYLTDYSQSSSPTIFKLSPSGSNTLMLSSSYSGVYTLSYGYSNYMYFRPNIMLWSNIQPDIWTRVCVTVDTVKRVAQVFNGSTVSIRKLLPYQYVWSGEPVIDFSGFDGQFTDVQVWNYPLNYKEIYNYMTSSGYGWYHGSVLTWSSIKYSPRGYTLLEDVYERQAKQPMRSRGRGHRPNWEKKKRAFIYVEGWKERQQL